jgi:glutamate-5-semialdehyde dehydrogenase
MDYRAYIEEMCGGARQSASVIANLSTKDKNNILLGIASALRGAKDLIRSENARDLSEAEKAGLSLSMIDRLLLDDRRIEAMALSVEEIAAFEDPVGRVEGMKVRPSGIRVGQMRVPLGVVAVIFESRPNVTIDIAALSIKSGNACILRGGKEALHSNIALHGIVRSVLSAMNYPESIVTLIDRTDRELVPVLLKQKKYIDVVIPRGGEGLIRMVTEHTTIPVIKHDKGLCHIYVDASAEGDMAAGIAVNAKAQRPGVCNSVETLLIHRDYPHKKSLLQALLDSGVEVRGCEETRKILPGSVSAVTEEDWDTEYLDLIISVKIVVSMEEAMAHIARHGSGHSEAIITGDYSNAERFLREVDSSAVFVNASTRFHDGGEFGLGAEVGISTEKLHARGAMGVEGLTTLKYIVYGHGEVR